MKFEDISLEIGDLVTKEALYGSKIYYGIVINISWDWRGPTQTIFHEKGVYTQSRRSLIYWEKV